MRSGRVLAARKRLAHGIAASRRLLLGLFIPQALRRRLDTDGFLVLGDFLTPDHFATVKAELVSHAWPFIEMTQWPANTLRVNLDAQLCAGRFPGLNKLLGCRKLRGLLQYTAGYSGTPLIALQVVRSAGVPAGHDPQTDWHCDTYHGLAKAWLFLHEVPADQGPFGYIPGSHRPTPEHWAWEQKTSAAAAAASDPMHAKGSFRVDEGELAALGYGVPFVAVVPGNTLVLADTSGFHRRTPSPQATVRIEIYLTLRRNPFFAIALPSILGLPYIRSHWAGWAYRHFERLVAIGKPGWIPLGKRSLTADEASLLKKESAPTLGPS